MIKQNLKTLIIEQDSSAAKTLREVFERFGFQVDHVVDMPTAVETLKHSEFDLVAVDSLIPDQTGRSCFDIVKSELAQLDRSAKIIATAPEITLEVRRKCNASGVNGIITKPFSLIPVAETLFTLD